MLRLLRLLAPYVVWLYPIGILVLALNLRAWLVASRDLRASLFTLEREIAIARMRRAAAGAFCTFGLLVGFFFVQVFLGRSFELSDWIRPTPTPTFFPRVAFVPTPKPGTPAPPERPTPTPVPTTTLRPTPIPITLVPTPSPAPSPVPSPTPTEVPVVLPPANCPTPGAQITHPANGSRVQGRVEIRGTASIPKFAFFKIELGLGEAPSRWTSISELHRTPVTSGLLDVWDTSGLPVGTYSLRLVVVDNTGNYPPPCEIRTVVTR